MRLLRRTPRPKAATFRPAEPYLIAAASLSRRLGHRCIGTEHILLGLIRNPDGDGARALAGLGVSSEAVEGALECWLGDGTPKIDPDALSTLGIDFDIVLERLEQTFGPGALERTHEGCLGVSPRTKLALAFAVDYAGEGPVDDGHMLLGLLSVPDSIAYRILTELGVSLQAARDVMQRPA
jgi:ATP-dependent Clp protease ATP-binding subunit ClpA